MIGMMRAAFSNFRFRSLFFRILFVFVSLVVLTVVTVSYLGIRYSRNVVNAEVKQSSLQMLEQTRRLMDVLLNDVDQITVRMAQNPAFAEAMNAGPEGPSDADLSAVQDDLLEAYTSSPYIVNVFVYYEASNEVQSPLTGVAKADQAEDAGWLSLYRSMNRSEGKWFVRDGSSGGSESDEPERVVTLIRTTPWVGKQVKGAIVVNLDQQVIFQSPSFQLMRPGEEIWMVSPDGALAFNSNTGKEVPAGEFDVLRSRLNAGDKAFTSRFRDRMYAFTTVTSPYTGWTYVDLITTGSLNKSGQDIQTYMLLLALIGIAAAAVASYFVTLRIYTPIYSLVERVAGPARGSGSDGSVRKTSELNLIFGAFETLKERGEAVEHQLRDHWPVLQQSFLRQLVQEKTNRHEERLAQFAYYRLPVTPFGFFVCVVRIDDYAAFVNRYESYDQSLIRYFIAKLACEAFGGGIRAFPLHTESRDVLLVCNLEQKTDEAEFRAFAERQADRIGELVREYLHFTVSIGIGERKDGAGEISDSRDEAVDALEIRAFRGFGAVAPSWRRPDRRAADHLLFRRLAEAKRDLLPLLREEQPGLLEERLRQLGDWAEDAENLPFPLVQHAFLQLLVDVAMRSFEFGLPMQSEDELVRLQSRIKELETFEATVGFAQSFIRDVNRRFRTEKNGERAPVSARILDYIDANFDKEISLGGIAERLQLDPSYVSRLFRQEANVNFMDYVISLRIDKSKELLRENRLTVKEIGAAVGYANQRSFNRIFKKVEGLTPGEYREKHVPKHLDRDEIY
ncbi:AraC family transcriptional regulator [Cohnella zeiphila]|uniref:AraC family transcriptional regulator n=1 Tax=Cohnella zeiphila TaxID=2761120 RepID=A0A7X0SM06_9BACL|nr:helix-turn-helix domain-containing protein [Cohnella zeiphila]MBB6732406.1 AraC family transcriptional regulator [Cohnella zeiphila]